MHGRSLAPAPGPIIPLPVIQTSVTSCVSCHQSARLPTHLLHPEQGMQQGSAPRCPPKAEGMGLSNCSSARGAAVLTCLRGPHAFQGQVQSEHRGASPLSRESRGRTWPGGTSDRSPPDRDCPGPRTHTTRKARDRPHTHTHTLPGHPVSSGGHFHTKTIIPIPRSISRADRT